jgi:hypothetical protein
LTVVGQQESDDESNDEEKEKGQDDDDSWIFDTIKDKKPHQLTNEEIEKLEKGPPPRVAAIKNDSAEVTILLLTINDCSVQEVCQSLPSHLLLQSQVLLERHQLLLQSLHLLQSQILHQPHLLRHQQLHLLNNKIRLPGLPL